MNDYDNMIGERPALVSGGECTLEELGGPGTPAFGFGMGIERLLLTLEQRGNAERYLCDERHRCARVL